jgi:TusA-related sulfurtransferase
MSARLADPTVQVMVEPSHSQRFLEYLAVREFDGIAGLIAPGARARLLLPKGPEERHGRDDIVQRIRGWFESASRFEVLSTSDEAIGERRRLSWRLRLVRDSGFNEVVEQLAFLDLGPEGIERLDLLCSGFQREQGAPVAGDPVTFDAGSRGCADGLAQEFRRQVEGVAVGASLIVLVSDPAAKEDLPPLARMLGHAVRSTQALEDGRLAITVERRK